MLILPLKNLAKYAEKAELNFTNTQTVRTEKRSAHITTSIFPKAFPTALPEKKTLLQTDPQER